MRMRDMDSLTLQALAKELEREARWLNPEKGGAWKDELARRKAYLLGKAKLYRRRAKIAGGGWAVMRKMMMEIVEVPRGR